MLVEGVTSHEQGWVSSHERRRVERPTEAEHLPYYSKYISLITESDVLPVLENQPAELRAMATGVPAARETFRYGPGKWSIREVIGHLVDGERVFGYRAFRIGRGDETPLPGFDENTYVARSDFDRRTLMDLVAEFAAVREANLIVFRRLDDAAWRRVGTANGSPISVRALAYIMAGHVRHHHGLLRERYGVGSAQ